MGYISAGIGKQLGNCIGTFVDYDANNSSGIWRIIRQPLKRWKKVRMSQNSWSIVKFKYEILPTFCFICGLLGHSDRFCDKLFQLHEEDVLKEWGSWLRAAPR